MKELYTLKELSDILNISWQSTRKKIVNNEINAVKIGKSYRVSILEINKYLKKMGLNNKEIKIIDNSNTKNCVLNYANKKTYNEIKMNISPTNFKLEKSSISNNLLIQGDNLSIMKKLLDTHKDKIDLIYIDPPFGTGQDFSLYDNDTAYRDKLIKSDFLEFLRERLFIIYELLSEKGSLYLHIDKHISHYVKIILDEIFGYKNFINEITRIKCNPKNFDRKGYGNNTDSIFYYAKNRDKQIFNNITTPLEENEKNKLYDKILENGRRYTTHPLHAPGVTKCGDTGLEWRGMLPPKGRHWRYTIDVLENLYQNNLIEFSKTGVPRKIVFADEHKGKKKQDIWEYKDKGKSYITYPTEKNHDMLSYIIQNSSNRNSIVMDCFGGSGSTAINAHLNGRKFITIDQSKIAINTMKENFKKYGIEYRLYSI
ncbi:MULTISPECIES: DNA methyltransferase [Aliarcobacter]|uniref:DNA methyltransferase n=1 Tax=Aliarcobacter TaxID=2321111 RepID=UPI0013E917DC|nr:MULTISPECIES: DNA methyltransferase [Aliarcobacter]